MTGAGSIWGPEMKAAAELAVEEINAKGGLIGKKVELIVEDDNTTPDMAVEKANKLVKKDKATVIIGGVYSNTRDAVWENVASQYQIPYIYPSDYEGGTSGMYFFCVGSLPNQKIEPVIPYIVGNVGKNWYFVGSDYVWPRSMIAHSKKILETKGGSCLGEEYAPIGTTEWSAIIDRIKKASPDILNVYVPGNDFVVFMKQFFDYGLGGSIKVVSHMVNELTAPAFEPAYRSGILTANSYFMAVDTDENRNFLDRYFNKVGENSVIDFEGEATYNSIMLWANAVVKAGSVDGEKVVEAMKGISFNAPQGKVTIDPETQHSFLNMYLAECQADGSFKIIENFGEIKPVNPIN